ncbi:Protein of unknown function DUF3511 [Dillenia turbinata]|uniref:Uncharacterized protein n=1 Tax=Dillenia turbinata TaxID=194707 RepID=A0AAN8V550_9MAGN
MPTLRTDKWCTVFDFSMKVDSKVPPLMLPSETRSPHHYGEGGLHCFGLRLHLHTLSIIKPRGPPISNKCETRISRDQGPSIIRSHHCPCISAHCTISIHTLSVLHRIQFSLRLLPLYSGGGWSPLEPSLIMEKSKSFSGYSYPYTEVRLAFEDREKSYSFNGPSGKVDGAAHANPELERRKRVASYNLYATEGKLKSSLRSSFKWIKSKFRKYSNHILQSPLTEKNHLTELKVQRSEEIRDHNKKVVYKSVLGGVRCTRASRTLQFWTNGLICIYCKELHDP